MHRITLWIALALSAVGMVVCYQINASGLTYNPAVPTDNAQETPAGSSAPSKAPENK
jgi:hypothetical protein